MRKLILGVFLVTFAGSGTFAQTVDHQLPKDAVAQLGGGRFLVTTSLPSRVMVSPDGRTIATLAEVRYGANDQGAQLFDSTTGQSIPIVGVPAERIVGFAWHSNSRDFAIVVAGTGTAEDDSKLWIGTVGIVDRKSGPEFQSPIDNVAWSPNGKLIAVATRDEEITIIDATSRLPVRTLKGSRWSLCFSNDSTLLASGIHKVSVWDVASGERDESFTISQDVGDALQLQFSPDDRQLAIAASNGMYAWDRQSEKLLRFQDIPSNNSLAKVYHSFSSLCYFDGGTKLAGVSGFSAYGSGIWDAETRKLEHTFFGVEGLGVSARLQSKRFVIGAKRLVYCDGAGQINFPKAHYGSIRSLVPMPNHRLLSVGHGGVAHEWDLKTFKHVRQISRESLVESLASSDNRAVVTVSNNPHSICVRDGRTRQVAWKWKPEHSDQKQIVEFTDAGLLPGNIVVTAEAGERLRFWNANEPPPIELPPSISIPRKAPTDAVVDITRSHVRTSPDGKWFVAWTSPMTSVSLFDSKTRKVVWSQDVLAGLTARVRFVAQAGQLVVAGNGVRFLDLESGKVLPGPELVNSAWVSALAVSPSGKYLAAAIPLGETGQMDMSAEKVIRIWNLKSGKLLKTLHGHRAITQGLTFSLDERYVISGDGRSRIFVWNTPGE